MPERTRDKRLQSIQHVYLRVHDRGETPDRQALLDAYPDLRAGLAEYFADTLKLESSAKSLKMASFGGGCSETSPSLGKIRYVGDCELLEEIARGGISFVYRSNQGQTPWTLGF